MGGKEKNLATQARKRVAITRYRDRACTFQWRISRSLCRVAAAAEYSRRVFDKFAEFYGSIYGKRGNATGRCSGCQITRIPVSLIGRSYAEERRARRRMRRRSAITTSNYVFLSPRGYDDTSATLISSLLLPLRYKEGRRSARMPPARKSPLRYRRLTTSCACRLFNPLSSRERYYPRYKLTLNLFTRGKYKVLRDSL